MQSRLTRLARYPFLAGALALACCAPPPPPPAPAPPPVQRPAPTPTPTPTPVVQQPVYDNWLDAPQTPGSWEYVEEPGETFALFGTSRSAPRAIIRCGRRDGRVAIGVFGPSAPAPIEIKTETAERLLTATPRDSGAPLIAADIAPTDPILDAIALTRGRFSLQTRGQAPLYLPAWAEVTRVIEDCR